MTILFVFLACISSVDTVNLSLDEAIEYGLKHNPEIEQLSIKVEKAEVGVNDAISVYYPSLSMSGYFAYLSEVPVLDFNGMPIPMGQHKNYSVSVSLQQVIFAWGKLYNYYKISEIQLDIAELTRKRKEQEIRYSITDGFFGLLILEEVVNLTKESFTQLERHEEAVEKRYRAGLVPHFELLRSQVQLANLKQQVIEAENGYNLAQEGFKMLLGMDLEKEIVIYGVLGMEEENYDLDELLEYAKEERIELVNMRNYERIAERGRDIARRLVLPTIVAGATYERSRPFGFGGDEWGSNLTFNVGFQFDIFSGFKTQNQYEDALLLLREAELAKENLEKAIHLEVKQSYLNLQAAEEGIDAARENVVQAEKAFSIIEERYRHGLVTNLEYLDTQLAQMQAKTGYLTALRNYHSARAALLKAVGKEED
jgi:outer membrane protein